MPVKDKTCTISGMRPYKLPSGTNILKLISRIEDEIRKSILQGFTLFQTGMAMGVDICAAEIINRLKTEYPEIRLICYLPCETQADDWTFYWRKRYFAALGEADRVICMHTHYTTGCIQLRNHQMIDSSSRLIAVYDEVSYGGTAQTIRYARNQNLDVIIINPLG